MIIAIFKSVVYYSCNYFNKNNLLNYRKFIKTEECFILGNGPSLNQIIDYHFSILKGKTLFVVNGFVLHPLFIDLKPEFYVLTDPFYWDDNVSDKFDKDKEILNKILTLVNWDMTLIVPFVAYRRMNTFFKSNKDIHVCFYNHTIIQSSQVINNFFYSKHLATPVLQNIIGASIFSALNLGFKKIYLLGVEHGWTKDIIVDKNNVVSLKHAYFWGEQDAMPMYDGQGMNYKIGKLLIDFGLMFTGYNILEEYSKYKQSKVVNLTNGSYIDAFYRSSIDEII